MRKRPDERRPSEAEARLFEAAMKDVVPLQRTARPKPKVQGEAAAPTPQAPRPSAAVPPPPAVASAKPALSAGMAIDVDARTMLRLRRGRIRPEGRLDLHGMTQAAAHRALAGFLARAEANQWRCVLVVTGTGRWREGAGVLREQVPKWLSVAPLRDHVLGFATAQPADGGDGAMYVLLRRRRTNRRGR